MNHLNATNRHQSPTLDDDPGSSPPSSPELQKTRAGPQAVDNESLHSGSQPEAQAQLPTSANLDWLQTRLRYPALGMCRR